MSANSKIAWCKHTFNPWIGCTQVSPGCAFCYAELLMDKRYGRVKWGKGQPRSRTSVKNWSQVYRWDQEAKRTGERTLVFCASLADWLDDEVPIEWLADLLTLIHATPHLTWLLLTKRPNNWKSRVAAALSVLVKREAYNVGVEVRGWWNGTPLSNVWVGISVEDQARMKRHYDLMRIPALVHWWSAEPLLSDLDCLPCWSAIGAPDWVIIGTESHGKSAGRNADNYNEHGGHIIAQCREAGVAVFNKQTPIMGTVSHEPLEWPEELRVREFPTLSDCAVNTTRGTRQ